MAEALPGSELSPEEGRAFLQANTLLQEAMLRLVEYCHQGEYQATLDCSRAALRDTLSRFPAGTEFQRPNEAILEIVLSRCFDTSWEKTLAKMRQGFGALNAGLEEEHEDWRED